MNYTNDNYYLPMNLNKSDSKSDKNEVEVIKTNKKNKTNKENNLKLHSSEIRWLIFISF